MAKGEIRLALVDDDKLFRQLLSLWLEGQGDMKIVFATSCGSSFLKEISGSNRVPDIVLLDIRISGMNGLQVLEEMQQNESGCRKIILTTHYRDCLIGQMLQLGADAFLAKDVDKDELLNVIRKVHLHGHYFSHEQVEVIRQQIKQKTPRLLLHGKSVFSNQEMKVLKEICRQRTANEIADRLAISRKTVEYHKTNMFQKTGSRNLAGLIIFAVQHQFIDPAEVSALNVIG